MKILVIRLGAIGDIIRTVPAVLYLKRNIKDLKLSWIAEDWAANLLINHPDIDRLYIVPRKKYSKIFQILKQIKKDNFDYLLDFHGILKSGLISYLSGIKKRIGYPKENCKEFNHLFNNIKTSPIPESVTRIEKNFNLIKPLIPDYKIPDKLETNFFIDQMKICFINDFYNNLKGYDFFIGINPCTSKSGEYKEWPIIYYKELIKKFHKKVNNKVAFIVTWGPDEYKKIEPLKNCPNTFLAPKTDMKELMVLISKLNLFITGDTGPMHLASTLNIPILALFGPSDSGVNRPWGKSNIVVKVDVGCNPCRNKKCTKLTCQWELKPEIVLENLINICKSVKLPIP